MADKKLDVIVTLNDKASGPLKNLSKNVEDTRKSFFTFGKVAAVAAITGLGLLGKSALQAAGQYEQSQIAFETMLGSAEKGNKLLNDLANFAKKTPFELVGIEANAKQLLAMGIESDDILPTLKSLGDVSAGLSVPMERLALNFGQVKAQGKLTGRELRDFAIAGVPLLDQLAKQMGVSKEEIQKMVSAGKIGFEDVNQAFIDMTSEGGKFEDLMDKQSESLNGMISNLKDAWDIFLRGEGQALLEWGKKIVEMLIYFVETVLPKVITGIKEFGKKFFDNFSQSEIDFKEIWDKIILTLQNFIDWTNENIIPTIAFLVEAFTEGVKLIKTLWDENFLGIQDAFKLFFDLVKGIIETGMAILRGDFETAWNSIKEMIGNIIDGIIETVTSFINSIKDAISTVKEFLGLSSDASSVQLNFDPSGLGVAYDAEGNPIQFAKGGIVPQYFANGGVSGDTVPAMLTPGEVILNAAQQKNVANGLQGGTTININGIFGTDAAEELGDMIAQKLGLHTAI